MDLTLRKSLWIVSLALAASCGVLLGRVSLRYLDSTLLRTWSIRVVHTRPSRVVPAPVRRVVPDGEATRLRNIFCSQCTTPSSGAALDDNTIVVVKGPVPSALPIELVATMVVPRDPRWSMAVIRHKSGMAGAPALYGRGGVLGGTGAIVEAVVNRKVYLRRDGHIEYVALDESSVLPSASVGLPAAISSETNRTIRCEGTRCTIERSFVEKLLTDPNAISSARFVPSESGVRVYAVRAGSLFAQLGLQNGDTIKKINGTTINRPDTLIELYAKLRSASHLVVEVERGGQTITRDYTIQ